MLQFSTEKGGFSQFGRSRSRLRWKRRRLSLDRRGLAATQGQDRAFLMRLAEWTKVLLFAVHGILAARPVYTGSAQTRLRNSLSNHPFSKSAARFAPDQSEIFTISSGSFFPISRWK